MAALRAQPQSWPPVVSWGKCWAKIALLTAAAITTAAGRVCGAAILTLTVSLALPTIAAAYPGELVHEGPYPDLGRCQVGHDHAWPMRVVSECREGNFDNKGYGWYFDYTQPAGA
ncbi:hypothetical protein HLB23_11250 [Nocardia uniformis]|uniref:Uncharacterized protein n=1 Tax=Nocardia uniformis TaxID=53432 RepID=A0A849C1V5_9NOCA|nr:hypothetical protein [Nocardia uniformis]NNH70430.1 hypothetical protein [Nocardia uniformis]